jgi:hypothetical protein
MAVHSHLGANAYVRPSSFEGAMAESAYYVLFLVAGSCDEICPAAIHPPWRLPFSGKAGHFNPAAVGVDQVHRNNVAALATISAVIIRRNPGTRYGVFSPYRLLLGK